MLESILIWLAETFLGQLFNGIFKPKAAKTVAQQEAENFAKPDGTKDDIINNL